MSTLAFGKAFGNNLLVCKVLQAFFRLLMICDVKTLLRKVFSIILNLSLSDPPALIVFYLEA